MGILCKKKTENKILFPSILDREIESINNDLFGHIHYAQILFSLIKTINHLFLLVYLANGVLVKVLLKNCVRMNF